MCLCLCIFGCVSDLCFFLHSYLHASPHHQCSLHITRRSIHVHVQLTRAYNFFQGRYKPFMCVRNVCVCVCACAHALVNARTHTHAHTRAKTHAYTHVHTRAITGTHLRSRLRARATERRGKSGRWMQRQRGHARERVRERDSETALAWRPCLLHTHGNCHVHHPHSQVRNRIDRRRPLM